MNATEIIQAEAQFIVQTYARPALVFTHGSGVYLFDEAGRRYLDFYSGIAVNALGHADAEWVAAVSAQAGRLTHVSNLFLSEPHVALARRLIEASFADRVFFCNSGAEANEAALKFARKYARSQGRDDQTGYLAFSGGFHGRTAGALSVTYKEPYRRPFLPLVPGVRFSQYNDLAAAAAAMSDEICAVIVEPVQGEGGVHPASAAFLQGLRRLCDDHRALLIFDEIQCGLGRIGQLWAHEAYGVTPDIMTLAKPLAGGLPIGATLVTEAVAEPLRPGDHGSTFAAGPLICHAATVVFDRVNRPDFLTRIRDHGAYLAAQLQAALPVDRLVEIRQAGLLLGLEFDRPVASYLKAAAARGLIIINAGENVIRLAPPLIVERSHIDEAVAILAAVTHE